MREAGQSVGRASSFEQFYALTSNTDWQISREPARAKLLTYRRHRRTALQPVAIAEWRAAGLDREARVCAREALPVADLVVSVGRLKADDLERAPSGGVAAEPRFTTVVAA